MGVGHDGPGDTDRSPMAVLSSFSRNHHARL